MSREVVTASRDLARGDRVETSAGRTVEVQSAGPGWAKVRPVTGRVAYMVDVKVRRSNPARRNPSLAVASPDKLARLRSSYEAWHWGAAPDKEIEIRDPYFPHCTGIGELREFEVGDDGKEPQVLTLPKGCWIAFDPDHPGERLYTALTPAFRERVRNSVKHAKTWPLQELARATGGDQARWPLPNIHAAPLGVLQAVVYWTYKAGEEDDRPSDYHHQFGKEHSKGIKPILAADVSGRLWVAGGAYRCPNAGITG